MLINVNKGEFMKIDVIGEVVAIATATGKEDLAKGVKHVLVLATEEVVECDGKTYSGTSHYKIKLKDLFKLKSRR